MPISGLANETDANSDPDMDPAEHPRKKTRRGKRGGRRHRRVRRGSSAEATEENTGGEVPAMNAGAHTEQQNDSGTGLAGQVIVGDSCPNSDVGRGSDVTDKCMSGRDATGGDQPSMPRQGAILLFAGVAELGSLYYLSYRRRWRCH